MARKIAKKEHSYTHGQFFSRISAVLKFVAEGPTRTLGSLNVATMRAVRDDSLHVRGPIRARSAQVPAHRTPTRAHVSTATGRASPQYEFPTFSEHSFRLWRSQISGSVVERALTREACVGECHGRPTELYHIKEVIGEGIFGVVNLVRSRHGGHDRCMKTVLKARCG